MDLNELKGKYIEDVIDQIKLAYSSVRITYPKMNNLSEDYINGRLTINCDVHGRIVSFFQE